MNLLLLLALAVPLSCLAFGVVIHVLGTVRARRPQWPSVEPANSPAG
jgi:hypothetical protein